MKFFRYFYFMIFACSNLIANSDIPVDTNPYTSSSILNAKANALFLDFICTIDFERQEDLNQILFSLEESKLFSDYSSLYQSLMSYRQSSFENEKNLDFENELLAIFNDQSQFSVVPPQFDLDDYEDPPYLGPKKTSMEFLYYLTKGTLLNELLLYKEAINVLSEAIRLSPLNRDAYIERAMAYFETNQLSLALNDYEQAKKLMINPPFKSRSQSPLMMASIYIPEEKTEFAKGLVAGTLDGAKVSANEFIPSIFSCCRGILNGLWAFVCSPIEVSQEMVNTAYAIGEFVSTHSTEECFQCVVPELKELSLSWDKLNDQFRGQKIGFMIGKYGVDIFAPAGALKGMNKVRALKRANTMCTLESCATSKAKQAKILEESIKRAALRESFINESAKKGKILTKTSNVQYHIMQPKHAWDKVLKLSGNVEEDFRKVLAFLEDKNIVNQKYLKNTVALPKDAPIKNIHLLEYRTTIEGQEIQVFFEKYLDTSEIFLKNGWVVTK